MARSGVLKSEIHKARDRLLAQGKHPSIDAVRAELGNTGSKTTIQRYLRELEEEEGVAFGRGIAVSDAIQDLVGRLAARLQEEAEAKVEELRRQYEAQLQDRDTQLAQQRQEAESLRLQLQRTEVALRAEIAARQAADRTVADANMANERLTQQVADQNDRLRDNEAHRQSLEDKHQHAREALEHYRQSVKDQREQEQRRHEQQVQQLQVEIRTLGQTVIMKQDELTRLHQDVAKVTAELAGARKDCRRAETTVEKLTQARDVLQVQAASLETAIATLTERLEQATSARSELQQRFDLLEGQAKKGEAELIQLRATVVVQAGLLAALTPSTASATPSAE